MWYVGGATWCFSESFAYQGVYCPSKLSLFSRPPSWQLVRTPKVIRLHNTHTQFRSGTCSKTLPLGALHSLALCSGESFAFFFVCSAFFVALRHQPGQLRNFRPAGFRSDGSGVHSHTLKLTEIADSTQFFPFLCLFFCSFSLPSRGNHFFLLPPRKNLLLAGRAIFSPSHGLRRGTATLFTDSSTGTTFPPSQSGTFPVSRELPSCCCSSSSPLCGQGPSLFFFFC